MYTYKQDFHASVFELMFAQKMMTSQMEGTKYLFTWYFKIQSVEFQKFKFYNRNLGIASFHWFDARTPYTKKSSINIYIYIYIYR